MSNFARKVSRHGAPSHGWRRYAFTRAERIAIRKSGVLPDRSCRDSGKRGRIQVPPARMPRPENYAGRKLNLYALGLHPNQVKHRAVESPGLMRRLLGAFQGLAGRTGAP
jgi:hypothetical protein